MRARTAERERARRLRAEGMSLRSIAAAVDASLSSVSVWVRGVPQPAPAPASAAPVTAAPGPRLYRWCPRCKAVIPTTSFNRSKGRWQGWCRPCFREYFAQRGDSHRAHVKRNKAARLRQGREHVLEILRSSQCADCGITDTTVLEFDHRGAKSAAVSALLAQACSLTRLKDEIAKCEVVCVNCIDGGRRATTAGAGHAPTGVAQLPGTRLASAGTSTTCTECSRTGAVRTAESAISSSWTSTTWARRAGLSPG